MYASTTAARAVTSPAWARSTRRLVVSAAGSGIAARSSSDAVASERAAGSRRPRRCASCRSRWRPASTSGPSRSASSWTAESLTAVRLRGARVSETEQPDGVVLEHQGTDLVLDRELLEVAQPAVGGDQRVVRAEEHLVLERPVRVADQVLREVLGRPAGEVDVDVRLVDGDRQGFVLPGEARVGEDDVQAGEV